MSNWAAKARKSAPTSPLSAVLPLYRGQKLFMADKARLKALLKSRQIGGSTVGTLEVVLDAIDRHDDWNTMSRTGRQAKKLLRKAGIHVNAIDSYVRNQLGQPTIIEKISSEEIVLKCGSVIAALPCDPDTTVGDTTNWYMDEVALYLNKVIYGTIKPSIMHGKRILMTSSPRGRTGKFPELYENWKNKGQAVTGWSFHVITLEDAVRDGLVLRDHHGNPISFEEFKRHEIEDIGIEMWLQEYMCCFQDLLTAFLSWDELKSCLITGSDGEPEEILIMTPEQLAAMRRQRPKSLLCAGFDVGRRHDLSVLWIVEVQPDGHWNTVCVRRMEKLPFGVQRDIVSSYLQAGCLDRIAIDANGIGMQICEDLRDAFGIAIEEVVFTNARKLLMAEELRAQIQARQFTMPAGEDDEIIEDFASIERIVTESDNVRLAAQRATGKTHGDYFWSAALAGHATKTLGLGDIAIAAA